MNGQLLVCPGVDYSFNAIQRHFVFLKYVFLFLFFIIFHVLYLQYKLYIYIYIPNFCTLILKRLIWKAELKKTKYSCYFYLLLLLFRFLKRENKKVIVREMQNYFKYNNFLKNLNPWEVYCMSFLNAKRVNVVVEWWWWWRWWWWWWRG